ncbi:spinster family MFS transporter [Sphingomonas sp. MMS24-J13]|uniref:spinster family MFS transporter n=1 Tax=Sphingomonas sp. MMS24-J13 TaxID=3238686 RepID=UPI003850BDBB
MTGPRPRLALVLLSLLYAANFVDRQMTAVLAQPIKQELGLSDQQLGLLTGLFFAIFYTTAGIPVARIAERRSRVAVIAVSVALWSAMTALSGLARNYTHLLLARLGVGIGEAGYAPAAQSLIADLFPHERRATALAIFSLGIPAGMLIGAIAGGWLAQSLGWRMAFIMLGLPGLLLALLVAVTLREPVRGNHDMAPLIEREPLGEVLRALFRSRAFVHMAAGASIVSVAGYGLTSFGVPILVRTFDLPLAQAATGYGLIAGVSIGLGMGLGGWLSDRLRSPGMVAAGGAITAAILFPVVLNASDPRLFGLLAILPLAGAHMYFGPTYGVTVNTVGPGARATAIAVLLMAMNAIGLGLGPWGVGLLSDHFAAAALPGYAATCHGGPVMDVCRLASAYGLKRALQLDVLLYFWGAGHFLLAARALTRVRLPKAGS